MAIINSELSNTRMLNGLLSTETMSEEYTKIVTNEAGEEEKILVPAGKRIVHRQVKITLNPGLNDNVTSEQLEMLKGNEAFQNHVDMNEMVIIQDDKGENPKNIKTLDMNKMKPQEAIKTIKSTATIAALDQFEEQEKTGRKRKAVLDTLEKQKKVVQKHLDEMKG